MHCSILTDNVPFRFLGGSIHPWGLHFGASVPALINNCDEEQYAELLPKVMSCEVLSTYAQTELGHGKLNSSIARVSRQVDSGELLRGVLVRSNCKA
jgi:alkylation response protein AidB-like acyl-CoA dehydrogenase